MFQPRVKLEFVRRYCLPVDEWCVCVDIDPSEEGRTGGTRATASSRQRQIEMQADADRVRQDLRTLCVSVGDRKRWCATQSLPYFEGDPDIVAYHRAEKRCLVAEVEGASSGQPEQKLYKAIGQVVRTVSHLPRGWRCHVVVVVYGDKIANHLLRARALERLDIAGLSLRDNPAADQWLFGPRGWLPQ